MEGDSEEKIIIKFWAALFFFGSYTHSATATEGSNKCWTSSKFVDSLCVCARI